MTVAARIGLPGFLVFLMLVGGNACGGERTVSVLHLNAFLSHLNALSRDTAAQRIPLISDQIGKISPSPDIITFNGTHEFYYRNQILAHLAQLGYRYSAYTSSAPTFSAGRVIASTLFSAGVAEIVFGRRSSRPLTRRSLMAMGVSSLALAAIAEVGDLALRDYGNGLLVVSRFPLETEVAAVHFYPDYLRAEDYFIFRGALRVGVKVPDVGVIDVVTANLQPREYLRAEGRYDPRDVERNLNQVKEFGEWYRGDRKKRLAQGVETSVVTGGFNFDYRTVADGKWTNEFDPAYLYMTNAGSEGLGLIDSYRHLNGFELTPAYIESSQNLLWAQDHKITSPETDLPGRVSDYIFLRNSLLCRPVNTKLVLDERLPSLGAEECKRMIALLGGQILPSNVSTHFGILTEVRVISSNHWCVGLPDPERGQRDW